MKTKPALIWDDWNKEHIKKHHVGENEVEEVYRSDNIVRMTYRNRILILGKTAKGRLMTIVISYEKQKEPYVVSARDMGRKERSYFYEKTKTDKTI